MEMERYMARERRGGGGGGGGGGGTESDRSSAPKLSLFSFPNQPPEPAGTRTPPLHTSASVPFLWEEAPGKPRVPAATKAVSHCLDLPPRLLMATKITNMPSPTTVLDGPYAGRSLSHRLLVSVRKGSFKTPQDAALGGKREPNFGSWRWGSFDLSPSVGSASAGGLEGCTKANIGRVERRISLPSFSPTSSNILASIKGGLKQALNWRSRREKQRKTGY